MKNRAEEEWPVRFGRAIRIAAPARPNNLAEVKSPGSTKRIPVVQCRAINIKLTRPTWLYRASLAKTVLRKNRGPVLSPVIKPALYE